MRDHQIQHHGQGPMDPNTDFTWRVLDRMGDSMTRQIREAVRIEEALNKGTHHTHLGPVKIKTMNRKEEHFQARKRPSYENFN